MIQNKKQKRETFRLRPYEKCEICGAEALSDAELLAVIMRTGSRERDAVALSGEILCLNGSENGLLTLLHHSYDDFLSVKGVGRVKALQLLCIGELSKRIWQCQAAKGMNPCCAQDVADFYREELRHLDCECVFLMLLDSRDRLLKSLRISQGTVFEASLSPREVFREALRHRACGVIVVHNHPSGDPYPSKADLEITRRLRRSGEELGVFLRDHVIIGDCCYFSFLENDMLNED